MRDQQTTEVPRKWLSSVVALLNEMAAEGTGMVDCADPADLMTEIAEFFGVAAEDDCWEAAVRKVIDDR